MDFRQAVNELEQASQLRVCKTIETAQASRVKHDDKWFILFGSNNYLGLNGHPILLKLPLMQLRVSELGLVVQDLQRAQTQFIRNLNLSLQNLKIKKLRFCLTQVTWRTLVLYLLSQIKTGRFYQTS